MLVSKDIQPVLFAKAETKVSERALLLTEFFKMESGTDIFLTVS